MRRLAYRGLTLANAPVFGHSLWTHALSKRTCPKFSNGLFLSTGSGRNPAVVLDLYRHTFLKDCGSHDKKTPARGMDREPDPAPGDGRKWAISGHLVLVENGSFHDHLGVGPWGGLFQLRRMVISFRTPT